MFLRNYHKDSSDPSAKEGGNLSDPTVAKRANTGGDAESGSKSSSNLLQKENSAGAKKTSGAGN